MPPTLLAGHLPVDHELSSERLPNGAIPIDDLPIDGALIPLAPTPPPAPLGNQLLPHLQEHVGRDEA